MSSSNLLLTGPPGVGKTTAVQAAARLLDQRRCGGFFTEEVCDGGGRRIGFALVTLDGQRHVMAHRDLISRHRVGRFGVDIERIDYIVDLTLGPHADSELFLVDEIGKMECFSKRFIKAVERLLDDPRPLVATVAAKGDGLIERVKGGGALWEVSPHSREALPARVADWVTHCVPAAPAD
jgi:nucleoside-triphosphatase